MFTYTTTTTPHATPNLALLADKARCWTTRRADGTIAIGKIGFGPTVICATESDAASILYAEAEMYGGEVCNTCEREESSPAFAPECRACYLARAAQG